MGGLRKRECKRTAMCKWKGKKNKCKLKEGALWEKQAQSVHGDDEEGEVEKPDDEEPEEEEEGEEEGEEENGCTGLRKRECKRTAMCKWKGKKNKCKLKEGALWEKQAQSVHGDD